MRRLLSILVLSKKGRLTGRSFDSELDGMKAIVGIYIDRPDEAWR